MRSRCAHGVIFVGSGGKPHTGDRRPHHSGSASVSRTEHDFSRGATPGKRAVATVLAWPPRPAPRRQAHRRTRSSLLPPPAGGSTTGGPGTPRLGGRPAT